MENVAEGIPASLYRNLSKNLIEIVLGTQDKNAVPADIAKKVIYLWRQDQLATPTGVSTLMEAAVMVDADATYSILDQLGLPEITIALKNLR